MVNICITIFLLLFALKPLLQSSNLYWCAIYILFSVGAIAQTSTIINGFRRKLFPQKQIKTLNTTLYIMPFISALGIFISFKYDHTFLTFLIFMLILTAFYIAVRLFLKPKNRSFLSTNRHHPHPQFLTRPPPHVGTKYSRICPNITTHTYSLHRTRISPPPFRGCLRICGRDKSAPTAANGLQQCCEQIAIYTRTPTKNHTFACQKPYFCTTNTILSQRKYHTFATQIPTFRTAKNYRRQIGRVAKTFC